MFSFAVLALLLVSCHVSGFLIPRDAPSEGWMAGYFEVSVNTIEYTYLN